MTVNKNSIQILLAVLGVVALFMVWQFVYKSYKPQTDALIAETATLQTEYDRLRGLEAQVPALQEEMAKWDVQIDGIIRKFPADIWVEDMAMYAVDLEKLQRAGEQEIRVDSLAFNPAAQLYQTGGGTTPEGEAEAETFEEKVYTLYDTQVTYAAEFSYQGLKDLLNTVYGNPDRRGVSSLSMAVDAGTGRLSGTVLVNLYSVTGGEREYQHVAIDTPVELGTEGIFTGLAPTREGELEEAVE